MTAVVQFVAKGQLVQSKYKPLSRLICTSLSGKFAETQRSYSLIPVENPLKSSLTVACDHREIQWWHAGLCGIAVGLCGQTRGAEALQAKCRCHQLVCEKKSDKKRLCDRVANWSCPCTPTEPCICCVKRHIKKRGRQPHAFYGT